jgi:hypothetical protein
MKTVRTLPIVQDTSGPISLRSLASSQGFTPPVSVTKLLKRLSVKTFQASVTTPDPEALGGHVDLTIRGDGIYELKVHMHDSGLPDYSFRLGVFLRSTSGIVFALYSRGTAHGTFSTGSRDFDETQSDLHQILNDRWDEFANGRLEVQREYQNNLVEWLESTVMDKVMFVLGAVTLGGPATLVIWGASSVSDLTGVGIPGELGLAGLILAEGQYFLFGPTYFIPVFIGGALVTAALFERRDLRIEEIDEAKRVFGDTVPYDKIVVSNLEGLGGRAFAVPNIDGNSVILGLGSDMFNSAIGDESKRFTFIHELTHAWQITHRATPSVICSALTNQFSELVEGRNEVYNYTTGSDWGSYNMEQQGQIVADWYWKKHRGQTRQGGSATADRDNERYIRDNILMERP